MSKTEYIWLRQADYDIQAAQLSLKYKFYEWSCFQSQQSAEKALKAFLVSRGERVPRVHRVSTLYKMCEQLEPEFRDNRLEHDNLEAITFVSRYPYAIPSETVTPHEFIDQEEALECLKEAQQIFQRVHSLI